jgi:hypothetical protein
MNNFWTENAIQDLIKNQIEENLNLDYKAAESLSKSSESKKKEIAKDVSAMANSDGGIIIYGIKEFTDSDKKHLPEKIDPINRSECPKEWLEQVINTNIFPRISNTIIEPLAINSSLTDVVYVVIVPKSKTAHQASDKRYYKRFNFESVPMYDYEIRDILNRAQSPVIEISFQIEIETYETSNSIGMPLPFQGSKESQFETITELIVEAYNDGKILANFINCFLEIPEECIKKDESSDNKIVEKDGVKYVKEYCENTVRDVVGVNKTGMFSVPNYGPARYIPILPKTRSKLTRNKFTRIQLDNDLILNNKKILWTVYADHAEPLSGEILMKNIPIIDVSKIK